MTMQMLSFSAPLDAVAKILEKLNDISIKLDIGVTFLYVAALVWLAFLGLWGLHLAKVYASVIAAGAGFYLGCWCFDWIANRFSVFQMFPKFTGYVIGLLFVFILFALLWKYCIPAIYLCLGVLGYFLASFFIPNLWVCIGAGFLMMILSRFVFGLLYIGLSACVGGMGSVVLLGAMYPNVGALQFGIGTTGMWIGVGVSVVFLLFQCVTTGDYRKFGV